MAIMFDLYRFIAYFVFVAIKTLLESTQCKKNRRGGVNLGEGKLGREVFFRRAVF